MSWPAFILYAAAAWMLFCAGFTVGIYAERKRRQREDDLDAAAFTDKAGA